jgi:hypothetical protein
MNLNSDLCFIRVYLWLNELGRVARELTRINGNIFRAGPHPDRPPFRRNSRNSQAFFLIREICVIRG